MPRKVKWVKSEKDIPTNTKVTSGAFMPFNNTIYLIKGKTPKYVEYHELFHAQKRHPLKAKSPLHHAEMEIEATIYAYKQTGHPHHMLGTLGGICRDLIINYHVSASRAAQIINHALIKSHAPDGWKRDLAELRSDISKGYWDGVGKEVKK
jgi:hypothetical protein